MLLLRLFVWRVLASHLTPHPIETPPLYRAPLPNHPHHIYICILLTLLSHTLFVLCLPLRLSFSLWYFYYYYFSRNSLFCSAVSLEKFNFYFFLFFVFFIFCFPLFAFFIFSSMPSTGCVCVCVLSIFMIIFCYFAPLFCSWNLAFTLLFPLFVLSLSIYVFFFVCLFCFSSPFCCLIPPFQYQKLSTHIGREWDGVMWGWGDRKRGLEVHSYIFTLFITRSVCVCVRVCVCLRGGL